MLFGKELYTAALITNSDTQLILALQPCGAGIGNAVALQNIAAVQAAAGQQGLENTILKKVTGHPALSCTDDGGGAAFLQPRVNFFPNFNV